MAADSKAVGTDGWLICHMCGRYSLTKKEMRLVLTELTEFILRLLPAPRYNIAPTQMAPVIVTENGKVIVRPMRWGLQPSWSKAPLINLQSESIATKPAFAESLRQRRCLVPADGFYEWTRDKQPMRFTVKNGEPFCFAGLWENWLDPGGKVVPCYSILTTSAAPVVAPVHDRMPLLVKQQYLDDWLGADFEAPIKNPFNDWESHAVGPFVNKAGNEGPICLEPPRQQNLF